MTLDDGSLVTDSTAGNGGGGCDLEFCKSNPSLSSSCRVAYGDFVKVYVKGAASIIGCSAEFSGGG